MSAEGAVGGSMFITAHTRANMPAPTTPHFHTLILAAGRGRRMGGPKALLDIHGQPWWRIQSERLAATTIPATWVVSEPVRLALAPYAGAPECTVGADPDAPMFASILAGLRELAANPPRGVFVLPVDAPAPGPAVWRDLASAADSAPVVIPQYHGKSGHPVLLSWVWIERTLMPAAASAADPRTLRLDALIAPVARHLPVTDPCVVINLNTPDDVSAYLAFGH